EGPGPRAGRAASLPPTRAAPVAGDTSRAEPARAALDAGAAVINDGRGLTAAPAPASLVARAGAGVIRMASERAGAEGQSPTDTVMDLLEESLRIAAQAGIPREGVVV